MKKVLCEHLYEVKSDLTQTEKNEGLWEGVKRSDPIQVTFYLAAGADVAAENNRAIRWATKAKGNEKVISYLLEAGADPTANSYEAFINVTKNADLKAMEYLLFFLQSKEMSASKAETSKSEESNNTSKENLQNCKCNDKAEIPK